jgi:hypothetical protein
MADQSFVKPILDKERPLIQQVDVSASARERLSSMLLVVVTAGDVLCGFTQVLPHPALLIPSLSIRATAASPDAYGWTSI